MTHLLVAYPALAIASAVFFGALVGSFLNVVILRLPLRMQWHWERDSRETLGIEPGADVAPAPPGIVVERSHCPKCGHKLAAWENVPILSFALLRGRCRACKAPISWQYPAVEAITALLFGLIVWRYGVTMQAGWMLVATGFLVAMSGIDMRTTLLPDSLTLPLLWLGLLLSLVPVFVPPPQAILGAAVGYLSLWSVYWAFKLLTGKEGMGYGDFKLLAAVGAFCGWKAILPVLLMSSLIGAIVGSIMLAVQGRDRATPIPFGPYLAAAGWVQLFWGEDLLGVYLRWAGM
ncbi:prepilin peptidase [Chiayiivirga flava]|uniref:Prepilin leader peptidase/N-methyltransferase n=1 Tax=Chiayiivirga flava TaxID=659595 RepID=A0A7W8D8Y8_9GAMM|nr:A24 family peptidase [Chiayiivirga flava]MBB5208967.1 leader peptidase (prepilin peptidase)/N-methyltransferase [Chiayiivirga flava]